MTHVHVEAGLLRAQNLECRDPDVVEFFTDAPAEARGDLLCRALAFGVVGLRAMGVAGQIEIVEREFLQLSARFQSALSDVQTRILQQVDNTFDPNKTESVSARIGTTVTQAHNEAARVIEGARAQLERLVADSFNPDLATSCVYRISKLVSDTREQIERAFDPGREGSYLARLVSVVDEYFGERGTVAEVIAAQVAPAKVEVLTALKELRDVLVGQSAAAEARRRSSASGDDFEGEVEVALRRLAQAYGDTVERVGTRAGEAGRAKAGDFVVQLREGPRLVVEAKDLSNPMPLRGERGILSILRNSMLNRRADFGIAVMKDKGGFPQEVGSFNEYDGDKLLCHFGSTGEMLETAYRWARAALLARAAREEGLDATVIEEGIDEARLALRELDKIEAKAKSIAKTAGEIQSLVTIQVLRADESLSRAIAGLTLRVPKAS